MHLTRREKIAKQTLFEVGYEYLLKNFSKFSTQQKIKIALELVKIKYSKGIEEERQMPPIVIEIENENVIQVEPLEAETESGEGISS